MGPVETPAESNSVVYIAIGAVVGVCCILGAIAFGLSRCKRETEEGTSAAEMAARGHAGSSEYGSVQTAHEDPVYGATSFAALK